MTKTFTLAVAFLAACVAVSPGVPPPKVLIIGVDGTRPDALALARTPNLDALETNGCFLDRAVTHPVTHSAAGWSSLFTGVWGDKPGVNDPGHSFSGNRFDLYPSFGLPADSQFRVSDFPDGALWTLHFEL